MPVYFTYQVKNPLAFSFLLEWSLGSLVSDPWVFRKILVTGLKDVCRPSLSTPDTLSFLAAVNPNTSQHEAA